MAKINNKIPDIIIEFAKDNGYHEPASDLDKKALIRRYMQEFGMDKADAEVWYYEMKRDDIEDFFNHRFKRKKKKLQIVNTQ